MSVYMYKGQSMSLDAAAGGVLAEATIGLGWYPVISKSFLGIALEAATVTLETACLMLDHDGNVVDSVHRRRRTSADGSLLHDSAHRVENYEEISVDLASVPARVACLVLTISAAAGSDFSLVDSAYCRIADADSGRRVAYFTLPVRGPHTAERMVRLYRCEAGWFAQALGERGAPANAGAVSPQAALCN